MLTVTVSSHVRKNRTLYDFRASLSELKLDYTDPNKRLQGPQTPLIDPQSPWGAPLTCILSADSTMP